MDKKELPKRKNTRMKNYNYNWMSSYFLTICSKNHVNIFGSITKKYIENKAEDFKERVPITAEVKLTEIGKIVQQYIESSKEVYKNIDVENYVIMPNHIHLLLYVSYNDNETKKFSAEIPKYVSSLKHLVNKECGENVFQRSYHDHIVRGEKDFDKIWDYIDGNPIRWHEDCFYRK